MESKYTKGKWISDGLHVITEGGKRVGQSYVMNFKHDIRGRVIKDLEGNYNAQIMACAPEMLEILMQIQGAIETGGVKGLFPSEKTAIINIIEKATKI